MQGKLSLFLFVAFVLAGGSLVGAFTVPGEWYAALEKPAFNPPPWLFFPMWSVLYVMIAVAGWRVWLIERDGPAVVAWWVQLALNFIWPSAFFVARNLPLALLIALVMLAVIVIFIVLAWRLARPAALLFLPYAAWVSFAVALNASLVWLN